MYLSIYLSIHPSIHRFLPCPASALPLLSRTHSLPHSATRETAVQARWAFCAKVESRAAIRAKGRKRGKEERERERERKKKQAKLAHLSTRSFSVYLSSRRTSHRIPKGPQLTHARIYTNTHMYTRPLLPYARVYAYIRTAPCLALPLTCTSSLSPATVPRRRQRSPASLLVKAAHTTRSEKRDREPSLRPRKNTQRWTVLSLKQARRRTR